MQVAAKLIYGYLWWIIDADNKIYAAIGNSGNVKKQSNIRLNFRTSMYNSRSDPFGKRSFNASLHVIIATLREKLGPEKMLPLTMEPNDNCNEQCYNMFIRDFLHGK